MALRYINIQLTLTVTLTAVTWSETVGLIGQDRSETKKIGLGLSFSGLMLSREVLSRSLDVSAFSSFARLKRSVILVNFSDYLVQSFG